MKRYPVVHPFLFAAYSIVTIIAANPTHIFFAQSVRSLVVIMAGVAALLLLLRLATRDWYRAGFLTSLGIFWLFFYGHLHRLIYGWKIISSPIVLHIILFSTWSLLLGAIGGGWVWRRVRPHVITGFLDLVAIMALLFPSSTVVKLAILSRQDPLTGWTSPVNASEQTLRVEGNYRPDIYYIIVDGYARADVLQELYQLDNSAFLAFLAERGFYVADQSRSNYIQTSLSLPSSLNFEYLDYLDKESWNRDPALELIKNSRVRALLKKAGYQIVAFSSGFFYTEIRDADLYLSPYAIDLNEFEQLLIETTAASILVELKGLDVPTFEYAAHRKRVAYQFDQLANVPDTGHPKFVFAHIIAPHPPFIFDRDGNPIEPDQPYSIGDGSSFKGSREDYIRGYTNQVLYVNARLEKTLDAILANSKRPPVIIVQADHGPGLLLNWESADQSCIKERMAILNAYYMPNGRTEHLYTSITPVNSFRVIFDTYLGTNFGLLEDKSYYSNLVRPYDFIDVTDQSDAACSAP